MSRRFTGARAICSLGALLLTLNSTGAALAFDERDTAVIGTFDLRDGDRAPDDAHQMYEDALDDLQAGERLAAQRQLERVISRAPDSRLAAEARRLLADLYAKQEAAAKPAAPPRDPSAAALREPQDVRVGEVSAEVEQAFLTESGDRVFFGSGSAELGARAKAALALQARWLRQRPDLSVVVEGFADDQPMAREQQDGLSEARARAVREHLVAVGVAIERIEIVARGRSDPVAECAAPECAAQNRRAITRLRTSQGPRHSAKELGKSWVTSAQSSLR